MSKEELLTKINQLDLILEAPKEIDSIMRTLISLGADTVINNILQILLKSVLLMLQKKISSTT